MLLRLRLLALRLQTLTLPALLGLLAWLRSPTLRRLRLLSLPLSLLRITAPLRRRLLLLRANLVRCRLPRHEPIHKVSVARVFGRFTHLLHPRILCDALTQLVETGLPSLASLAPLCRTALGSTALASCLHLLPPFLHAALCRLLCFHCAPLVIALLRLGTLLGFVARPAHGIRSLLGSVPRYTSCG